MKRETAHWESDSKLLCGASLDVDEDRFLLDPRWVKHVTCESCIEKAKRIACPACAPTPGRSGK